MVKILDLAEYRKCEAKGCNSSRLYFGGIGTWRTTIMCETCFHVRRGVSTQVITTLVAESYGLDPTEAQERDKESQVEYEEIVARGETF